MRKKVIAVAAILVVLAGLGVTAHMINFAGIVKKVHGG